MKLKDVVLILLALVPVVYVLAIWNSLPVEIPTHFNAKGEADDYSGRGGFVGLIAFMAITNIGTYLLVNNIHRIDPKRATAEHSAVFNKLATGLCLFLTALNFVIVATCLNPESKTIQKALLPLLGLMFVFLGNYMYNVKPNYFVGIRVPWAMNDEENWKKTHRVGGSIWFAGGLIIAVSSLFTSMQTGFTIMMVVIAVMVIIPFAYSYMIFRNKQTSNTQ